MLFPILKDTYTFYWQNLRFFAAIMLPLVIPMELLNTLLQSIWPADPMQPVTLLPGIMVTLIFYPIYQTALVLGVKHRLSGELPPIKQLIQQGGLFWFAIVVVNVLFYLAMFVGLMLLVIPAIYIGVRWSLAEQNVVLNQEGPIDALKSSWEDTSDVFWLIFGGSLAIVITMLIPGLTLFSWFVAVFDYAAPAMFISAVLQSLFYPLLVVFFMRVRHYIKNNE